MAFSTIWNSSSIGSDFFGHPKFEKLIIGDVAEPQVGMGYAQDCLCIQ